MGPTLRAESIGPGDELRHATKRDPSIRVETDTPTHPGLNPESVGELLTRPDGVEDCSIGIKMTNNTGIDAPGIPTVGNKPNLGELLLKRYRDRICTGFDDLENFELIDRLEKPVLDFIFYGNKRIILEVYNFISQFPYAFIMRTKKGYDLWSLPQRGSRNAYVYISRFPKLIKFLREYESQIPDDLWGIIHGYPLREIHQFTYDWAEWTKKKDGIP